MSAIHEGLKPISWFDPDLVNFTKDLTPAAESDSAVALTVSVTRTLTPATETGSAQPLQIITGAYAPVIMGTADLVAYWRLNENAGTTAEDLADSHDGSIGAGVTKGITGLIASDAADDAMDFAGGGSGFITVSDHADLRFTSHEFSAEAWIALGTQQTYAGIFGFYENGGAFPGWAFTLNGDGGTSGKLSYYGAGTWTSSTGTVPADGSTHHVAMTISSTGTLTFYIDGVSAGSATSIALPNSYTGTKRLGQTTNSDGTTFGFIDGVLDELALYNRDLTASEVLEHYDAGTGAAGGPITLTPASETDAAQALNIDKAATLAAATEADAAQALNVDKALAVGQAVETDSAAALDVDKAKTLVAAAETDSAQALVVTKTIFKSLTPATEADAGQPLDVDKTVALTAAAETDAAQTLSISQAGSFSIAPATETDTAQALSVTKTIFKSLTPATEADAAQALDVDKPIVKALAPADETDSAQTLSISQAESYSLTPATETDSAVALTVTKPILKSLVVATETGSAVSLTLAKQVTVTATAETGLAQALTISKAVTLTAGAETDAAVVLSVSGQPQLFSLTAATEADAARALAWHMRRRFFDQAHGPVASLTEALESVTHVEAGSALVGAID